MINRAPLRRQKITSLRSFFERTNEIDDVIFNALIKIENAIDSQAIKAIKSKVKSSIFKIKHTYVYNKSF